MIWYDIIVQKLVDMGYIVGQDLFLDQYPQEADIGVLIRSPLEGIDIDPYLPGYYSPDIQIILRHSSPLDGAKLALAIMKGLTVESEEFHAATDERGQLKINRFFPKQLPIRYPSLSGNTVEFSINFQTSFVIGDL